MNKSPLVSKKEGRFIFQKGFTSKRFEKLILGDLNAKNFCESADTIKPTKTPKKLQRSFKKRYVVLLTNIL